MNDLVKTEFLQISIKIEALSKKIDKLAASIHDIRNLIGPFGVPLPDGTILVQTIWGIKLKVQALDLIMTPQLVIYRQWEADLSAAFVAMLNPDTVFVDVGANIGYFSTLIASRIGSSGKGKVVAIEPNPNCLDLLRQNLTINWSLCPVSIHPCAVSDCEGSSSLIVPKNQSANAYLGHGGDDAADAMAVRIARLDDLLSDVPIVDILKIDVEGHELRTLAGAKDVISRSKYIVIVMEWSLKQLEDAGTTPEMMVNLFDQMGLLACRMEGSLIASRLREAAYDMEELKNTKYTNIALVHNV